MMYFDQGYNSVIQRARRDDDENSVQTFRSRPKSERKLHVTCQWPVPREVKTNGLGGFGALTIFIDMRLGVFSRVFCELMPVYAFEDVRSVYMRVCCARMSSDVLNDIILCLNYAASAYGKYTSSCRTSCCVLG